MAGITGKKPEGYGCTVYSVQSIFRIKSHADFEAWREYEKKRISSSYVDFCIIKKTGAPTELTGGLGQGSDPSHPTCEFILTTL